MKEGLTFGERLRLLAGRQRKVCTEGKEGKEGAPVRGFDGGVKVCEPDFGMMAEGLLKVEGVPDVVVCGSKSPGGGLVCNREPGHDGRCGAMTSATCARGWWEKPGSGHAVIRDGEWVMPEDGVDGVDLVDGIPWAEWKAARERCAAKRAPSSAARWIRHLIREADETADHLAREGSSEDVLAAAQTVRARWVELLRDRGYEVDEVEVPCGHELSDLREWFDKGGRL